MSVDPSSTGTVDPAGEGKYWADQAEANAKAYTDAQGAANIGTFGQRPTSYAPRDKRPSRPIQSLISSFQSGHGWTVAAGTVTSLNANDTTSPGLGTQSATIVTNNLGDNFNRCVFASPTLTSTYDMTKYDLAVLFKVDDSTKLNYLHMRYGPAGDVTTNFYLTDFAYSARAQDVSDGQWEWIYAPASSYTVAGTPSGRTAINRFAINVADKGAGAATVHIGAVALVPKLASTLYPHGVAVIWFDDAYQTALTNGASYMDKYGFAGVQSPIWDLVPSTYAGGTYMGMDGLTNLHDIHGWDIVAHSMTAADHNATNAFDSLSVQQLHDECGQLKDKLVGSGFERGADIFAYPQGYHSAQTMSVAKQYFAWARTTNSAVSGISAETLPPMQPLQVRTSVLDTRALSTFTNVVDQIYAEGGLGIFYTHQVTNTPLGTETTPTIFNGLIDYIATKGTPVRTISDVLASLSGY